jgi:hypothetical protein
VGEDGLIKTAAANEARFDHNPVTGESLGLLIEEQRTNSIRNNTMVGAAAGTPGTLPTNWLDGATGLTRTVVGTGTANGVNYIDIRYNGTTSGVIDIQVKVDGNGGPLAGSTGQSWTLSSWVAIVGGSTANITNQWLVLNEYSAGPTYLRSSNAVSNILANGATLTRMSGVITLGASTTIIEPIVVLRTGSSVAVDITLRIGLPQLEQGAFATSVIPTTTATVTRAADVASITGSNFSSFYNQTEGSFFCSIFAPKGNVIFGTGDTFDNTQYATVAASNNVSIRSGGSDQAILTAPVSSSANTNIAFSYASNSFAALSNGGTLSTDTTGNVPAAQIRLKLGTSAWDAGASNSLNGTIRRLTYWPARLPNTTLQSLTQ